MSDKQKTIHLIKSVGHDIAVLGNNLLGYSTRGERTESLPDKEAVELNLKIFDKLNAWYDKMINNPGNLAGVVDSLSKEDKDFLIKVKSLESSEEQKYF